MLTIIIPAYNHERYVLESLVAAREVNVPDAQIIVIDDGSTDGTLQVVKDYLVECPADNVKVLSKPNGGLVSSLVWGLELVDTPYIYIVASDDVPIPAGIIHCLERMECSPELKFCVGGGENYFEDQPAFTSSVYGEAHDHFFQLPEKERGEALFLDYPQPILLQSTIFRVDALKEIGGWDREILLDDYPTFIKMFSRFPTINKDFIFLPDVLVVKYRQHGSNSYKNVERQFGIVKQMLTRLAPIELYPRAMGKVLALHFLGAVRSGQTSKGFKLLKNHSLCVYLNFSFYLAFFIFRFLLARLRK